VSSRLGDAVLDPALWPAIMEDISRAVGATGATLLQADVRTPDVPHTEGLAELFKAYFQGNWHIGDIRARGAPLLASGAKLVITDYDSVTAEEMRDTAYYNDLLRPFGFRWFAAVGFRAGSALWGLSLHRTARQGLFEGDELNYLEELTPRLSNAATLSLAVGRSVLSGITNALDLVGQPALILDRSGGVLATNARADRLFDDDIRLQNRRIVVKDSRARINLDTLFAWVRNTAEPASIPIKTIVVRRQLGQPVLIRVLPIPPSARSAFVGARVLLTLVPSALPPDISANLLIEAFELTSAEAKLGVLIGRGATLHAAAEQLGVTISTVRNQLKGVFLKTTTHRQSELAILLSRFLVPR